MKVLAILVANNDKPNIAARQVSTDANLIGARNLLMKLNVITYSDAQAKLTDTGMILAADNNIIDDSGNLTDVGSKFLSTPPTSTSTDTSAIDISSSGESLPDDDLMSHLEGFSPLFSSLLLY
jgi:hypothetical protein